MYITTVGIAVLNVVVITKNTKDSNTLFLKYNHSTKYYNLIFVLNLSFSDVIYGLGVIAF